MLHTLVLASHLYTVRAGNTLSSIASQNGVSLAAVEAANPQLGNYNLIVVGETVNIPGGSQGQSSGDGDHDSDDGYSGPVEAPSSSPSSPITSVPSSSPASSVSGSSGGSAGGAPGSFQACVIQRESGGNAQVMNSSGHYGLYQFSAQAWAQGGGNPGDFGNASVAEQNQVFQSLYAQLGTSPWQPYDGCT